MDPSIGPVTNIFGDKSLFNHGSGVGEMQLEDVSARARVGRPAHSGWPSQTTTTGRSSSFFSSEVKCLRDLDSPNILSNRVFYLAFFCTKNPFANGHRQHFQLKTRKNRMLGSGYFSTQRTSTTSISIPEQVLLRVTWSPVL